MRWFKPNIRSSIYALFGSSFAAEPAPLAPAFSVEDIRESMLALLAEGGGDRFPQVVRRVRYATDVQALWFLRGDLMAVLAAAHGEGLAQEKLEAVSAMFRDMLPAGLRVRPSPLSSGMRT